MVPGWSGTQRLVTRFGAQVVRRLSLAGEIVTAERALTFGLLDEVAPRGGSLNAARAWADPSPSAARAGGPAGPSALGGGAPGRQTRLVSWASVPVSAACAPPRERRR